MATPTTANLPTRQQLDEIDALLRRMLTLPSLAGESTETPRAPSPASPQANLTFAPPIVREVPPPQLPAPNEPVVQAWRVSWPQSPAPTPTNPASVVAWGSPVTTPAEVPPWAAAPASPPITQPPFALPVNSPPATMPVPPMPARPPSESQQSESLLVLLLIVLNGLFNVLTYLLGPIGTWLRGPGRGAMGWAGIFMILAGVVWASATGMVMTGPSRTGPDSGCRDSDRP